jgi:DNA gyrase/topoisomerase IV subunit A
MGLTGGELNILNGGGRGISAPDKSVPVMKLIKVHKPKSKEELVNLIENKAKDILSKELNGLTIEDADNYYDEELRIDLEIKEGGKTIAGIQVKPSSYKKVRKEVQFMNQHRNKLVSYPVFYLFYDYDSEDFLNLSDILEEIRKWTKSG